MRKTVRVSLFLLTMIAFAFIGVLKVNIVNDDINYLPAQFFTANEISAIEIKSPVATSAAEIIRDVEDLYSRWTTSLNQPGWFYVATEVEQSPGDYGTLPNGTQIPADYRMNEWYLLDGAGIVLASVGFMQDSNGLEIQRTIFTGSMWHNLAVQESWSGSPYMLDLDSGMIETLLKGSEWYGELSTSELILEGREVIDVITAKGNGQFSAMFDLGTGQPMGSCLRTFDTSGVLINFSCGKIVNMTWDEPPQELLLDLERLSSQ